MEETNDSFLRSSQGSVRFFIFLVLSTSLIFLVIVLSPSISNRNSQNFMRDEVQDYDLEKPEIVNQHFAGIKVLKPDEVGAIYDDFTVIWSSAKTDLQKYGAYSRLYGILWAKHNVTKDLAVRLEMNEIEKLLARNWPQLYKVDKENRGFIE